MKRGRRHPHPCNTIPTTRQGNDVQPTALDACRSLVQLFEQEISINLMYITFTYVNLIHIHDSLTLWQCMELRAQHTGSIARPSHPQPGRFPTRPQDPNWGTHQSTSTRRPG